MPLSPSALISRAWAWAAAYWARRRFSWAWVRASCTGLSCSRLQLPTPPCAGRAGALHRRRPAPGAAAPGPVGSARLRSRPCALDGDFQQSIEVVDAPVQARVQFEPAPGGQLLDLGRAQARQRSGQLPVGGPGWRTAFSAVASASSGAAGATGATAGACCCSHLSRSACPRGNWPPRVGRSRQADAGLAVCAVAQAGMMSSSRRQAEPGELPTERGGSRTPLQ